MSDLQWTSDNIKEKSTHLMFLNKTIELSMLHIIEDFSVKRWLVYCVCLWPRYVKLDAEETLKV